MAGVPPKPGVGGGASRLARLLVLRLRLGSLGVGGLGGPDLVCFLASPFCFFVIGVMRRLTPRYVLGFSLFFLLLLGISISFLCAF